MLCVDRLTYVCMNESMVIMNCDEESYAQLMIAFDSCYSVVHLDHHPLSVTPEFLRT